MSLPITTRWRRSSPERNSLPAAMPTRRATSAVIGMQVGLAADAVGAEIAALGHAGLQDPGGYEAKPKFYGAAVLAVRLYGPARRSSLAPDAALHQSGDGDEETHPCAASSASSATAPVAARLVDSLKRLEYRGYDFGRRRRSCRRPRRAPPRQGQAPRAGGACWPPSRWSATTGIGHTRWATHGAPSLTQRPPADRRPRHAWCTTASSRTSPS